ncbi:peptidase S8 [Paenibacillus sp. CAA11]|uniref:S8 family peptidase n=1 Tax=Paenibacillus sp. CAA11 TaxID=1532905 RepID=UPI000D3DC40A|nr:S8 family peptidase [Paenibacillus sp. CAA11]AWB42882.1 peptidase S8 [Paenibacillus sp. CAA11]
MDYSEFLRFLGERLEASPNSEGQRRIITFNRPNQYLECLAELKKQFPKRNALRKIRPSSLLQAFVCPLTLTDIPACYRQAIRIEPDARVQLHAISVPKKDSKPSATIPWGVKRIRAPEVWSTSTGLQVRIGVIDTGADFSHPDLRYSLARGVNLLNRLSAPHDDNGHGTHIAGTIAAAGSSGIIGVAPRAIIYPVKAFDHNGAAYVSDIILGIDWCVQNRMQIINMSFGMKTKNKALEDIVRKAHQAGVVIVASSGNDKKRRYADYPARYPETISIGATGKDRRIAKFSNRGTYVDIYAPGEQIRSCWIGGTHKDMNGTSMATSHVSGAIALLLARSPGLPPDEIKALLRRTARSVVPAAAEKSRSLPGEVDALRLVRKRSKPAGSDS